jgi:hypothetical protein
LGRACNKALEVQRQVNELTLLSAYPQIPEAAQEKLSRKINLGYNRGKSFKALRPEQAKRGALWHFKGVLSFKRGSGMA